ncbi:MAG: flagellar hook-basal body complex protein FliE [Oscillospiraceae bacterium]
MIDFIPISTLQPMKAMTPMDITKDDLAIKTEDASFLDIFRGLVDNVIETNEQVDRDAIDIMLGNIDDLAQVQSNIEKAAVAVDLLVAVKNEALSAYNTIISMQV